VPSSPDRKHSAASSGSTFDVWHRKARSTETAGTYLALSGSTPSSRRPSPSPDRSAHSLGLHIVHQPGSFAPLDIIFVHGLGGDSRKTWSKNHDTGLFWPGLWLPLEPGIGNARVLTFGYNANFRPGAPKSLSNMTDFSKELLYEMGFGKDDNGQDLNVGKVPIIFVVHSMGGLVVKKAYILGQNDEEYQHIIRSVSAIVFLATPHRGTNLAEVLNRVLKVSLQSPQQFIADLNKSSPALEDLHEQFRHIAPKLSIVSFYETLATPVGPKKMMVLEKDSSILGYPKEVSKALDADHHDVCKFSDPQDPNYVSVRNALQTLVGRFQPKGVGVLANKISEETKDIKNLLGISSSPEDDFNALRKWWVPGTCEWLLKEPEIQSFLEASSKSESRIVWFSAPPANGKSILATHLISHMQTLGLSCQYFFFKFNDQTKQSLSLFLRSIAYHIADDFPEFRRSLVALSTDGLKLENADSGIIWHRVFESILFKITGDRPLFWIIDGLDESESPKALLDLFRSIPSSKTPIRIFFTGRRTSPLSLAFDRLSTAVRVDVVGKEGVDHNLIDIKLFVEKEMNHMRGTSELKQQVYQSIMTRAHGNFLWVRLVLEEILSCHSEDAIHESLDDIPDDMSKMYERMEMVILNNPRKSDRKLASVLLQWTTCAQRSLSLGEMSQALQPEYPKFIDLKRTIQDVCGQFALVDQFDRVAMVHQTACDYLINTSKKELAIEPKKTHWQLFNKSISIFLDSKLRFLLRKSQTDLRGTNPFLFYAAHSWPYHLKHAGINVDDTLDLLVKFFRSQSVLIWIHSLAMMEHLEVLVKASKALSKLISATRKINAAKNPLLHRLSDLDLIDLWSIDLVKIVGKFGRHLASSPLAIYKLIPPLCPSKSAIYTQFHQPESAEVSISGISNDSWNDNLARITLPNGDQAWQITCAGPHVVVLRDIGTVSVWNCSNFAEICTLHHHEPVTTLCLNLNGSKLATYGLRSTKLWSLPSGQELSSTPNPGDSKAMAMEFVENDSKLLVGGDDKVISYIKIHDFEQGWHTLDAALLKETSQIDGTFVNSPMGIAFNGDRSQVGVCYRGFPLSVWSLSEARCIGRCRRAKDPRADGTRPSTNWFAVDRFTWNPISGHIIGIYKDGTLFKWHPLTDERQEVQTTADEVAASSDGKLFLTSNSTGTVKVWNFHFFTVVYQLHSEDLVTGLAFSPDCRRFYDIRGSSINVWESNSLTRFSQTEESFSDAASEDHSPTSISQISEAHLVEYEPVTIISRAPNTSLYCVGNEEGTVDLFDARNGSSVEITKFFNFFGVSHVAWGEDGKHVAAADLGGNIVLKFLALQEIHSDASIYSLKINSLDPPKVKLEGSNIHEIIFNHNSKSLLVISDDKGHIWRVDQGKFVASATLSKAASRKWLQNPINSDYFLGFGDKDVVVYRWKDFAQIRSIQFREYRPRLESKSSFDHGDEIIDFSQFSLGAERGRESTSLVIKAVPTQDREHIMVQIRTTSGQGRISKRLLIFNSSTLAVDSDDTWAYLYIPPQIAVKIEFSLGVLAGSRLAFLDEDLWVCTYRLGSSINVEENLQRHYFIPRDWASSEGLEQCCMMEDGTLLCPREDKVAVIRSNLDINEF
jgi:WD40 repeat protein/pimeloyl-ACP methyl ester carboxylesterase